jgi:hypothetical protein
MILGAGSASSTMDASSGRRCPVPRIDCAVVPPVLPVDYCYFLFEDVDDDLLLLDLRFRSNWMVAADAYAYSSDNTSTNDAFS